MTWKGGFDRSFTPEEFDAYVETLKWTGWRPQFVVVHNTGAPNLAQWKATPGGEKQRIANLEHYYKNQNHWSSGPHLFVGAEKIWLGTPLTTPGTHSPSWNSVSIGMEIAGDYDHDAWAGPTHDMAIAALASLHTALGLSPSTLRLHKEDKRTTHDCPGKNIVKADLIAAVKRAMLREGEHTPADPEVSPAPAPSPATHVVKAGDTLYGIAKRYGLAVADLAKWNGSPTSLAVGMVLALSAGLPKAEAPPTTTGPVKKASRNLAKFIGGQEAFVAVRYMDKGTPAIGFGHNDATIPMDMRITVDDGLGLLMKDLGSAEAAVTKAVHVPLAQHEFDALCDFAYNLGGGALAGASLVAKLNAGDRQGAADGLLKWNKARNSKGELEVLAGLTKRREAERKMFLTGDYGDISAFPLYNGDPKTTKPVRTPFPA